MWRKKINAHTHWDKKRRWRRERERESSHERVNEMNDTLKIKICMNIHEIRRIVCVFLLLLYFSRPLSCINILYLYIWFGLCALYAVNICVLCCAVHSLRLCLAHVLVLGRSHCGVCLLCVDEPKCVYKMHNTQGHENWSWTSNRTNQLGSNTVWCSGNNGTQIRSEMWQRCLIYSILCQAYYVLNPWQTITSLRFIKIKTYISNNGLSAEEATAVATTTATTMNSQSASQPYTAQPNTHQCNVEIERSSKTETQWGYNSQRRNRSKTKMLPF